jgi:2,3-bisphosphoglycerate-dependent phosphoglycerate mutase
MNSNNNYCNFYIVRHGETDWNRRKKIQGHSDSQLTEEAIASAREFGKQLNHIEFSAVFSSDLSRAKQTAQLIKLRKKATVTTTQLLRERKLGVFEGKKVEDLNKKLRELLYQLDLPEASAELQNNNVETIDHLLGRVITFLRQTAIAYPNKNVLVVTHAGLMGHLLVKLRYLNAERYRQLLIDNLGHFILKSDGVEFDIVDSKGIKYSANR